jgi:hypothetical protein
MRVLVCGGRDFQDDAALVRVLDELHAERPFTLLIHGAARGADRMAGSWAAARGIPCQAFPADWERLQRRAGPERNGRMLREGRPDLVVAFPGGTGTADMVRRAGTAGVPVSKPLSREAIEAEQLTLSLPLSPPAGEDMMASMNANRYAILNALGCVALTGRMPRGLHELTRIELYRLTVLDHQTLRWSLNEEGARLAARSRLLKAGRWLQQSGYLRDPQVLQAPAGPSQRSVPFCLGDKRALARDGQVFVGDRLVKEFENG